MCKRFVSAQPDDKGGFTDSSNLAEQFQSHKLINRLAYFFSSLMTLTFFEQLTF
jgi:hypothetical protein